eukprot:TRINITY_DN3844_c1_g1_i2.p1 TRINITY_DN3844_c1_g1~~TRINITY_DN3844_c1_g1_i2.p1  ORF type:complete len:100 (+),score=14.54 TRINITY_DN3844_c1_g1_i2:718-1017(+)
MTGFIALDVEKFLKGRTVNFDQLGFPQAVHVDRLIAYDHCALQDTTATLLLLEVTDNKGEKWRGEIQQQTATGLVRIKWDATGTTEPFDLAGLEYDWID